MRTDVTLGGAAGSRRWIDEVGLAEGLGREDRLFEVIAGGDAAGNLDAGDAGDDLHRQAGLDDRAAEIGAGERAAHQLHHVTGAELERHRARGGERQAPPAMMRPLGPSVMATSVLSAVPVMAT